jgi:hypothetical protein
MEHHRLRVSENRVLRRNFVTKKEAEEECIITRSFLSSTLH